jgi:hypothetical protein
MGGAPIGFLARAALLFCACPGIERRPRLLRLPDLLDRADAAALLAPLPSLSAAIRIRRGALSLGLGSALQRQSQDSIADVTASKISSASPLMLPAAHSLNALA